MITAILSCYVFHDEVKRVLKEKDTPIVLVEQGIHDYADHDKMRAVLQKYIDDIEKKYAPERIILLYGYCGGGIVGLTAKHAELVIPRVHDCIALLLNDEKGSYVGDTFYFSRGWIDCGGDTLKESMFLTGRLEEAKSWFDTNAEGVNWWEKEQFAKDTVYDEETADYICYECIKNYHAITLIDNDNLTGFYKNYMYRMRDYMNRLFAENGHEEVELKTVRGDLSMLDALVNGGGDSRWLVVRPGGAVKMGDFIEFAD